MDVVHKVCGGLDVHKKSVTACVLWASGQRPQKRKFGTFTKDLLEMSDWPRSCGVNHVALESTGVYWKPVWNILEGQFEMLLANAQHIKAPGRKTDQRDSEWIADLRQHLVIAYYILRDGTCYNELGADYFDRLNPEGLRRRLTKQLEGLGFKVTLEPLAQVA
jgi:hypothetical protein